jgi:hypothetical protein
MFSSVKAMKGDADIYPEAFSNGQAIGIGRQLLDGEADVSILHSYHLLENVYNLKPLTALGQDV